MLACTKPTTAQFPALFVDAILLGTALCPRGAVMAPALFTIPTFSSLSPLSPVCPPLFLFFSSKSNSSVWRVGGL